MSEYIYPHGWPKRSTLRHTEATIGTNLSYLHNSTEFQLKQSTLPFRFATCFPWGTWLISLLWIPLWTSITPSTSKPTEKHGDRGSLGMTCTPRHLNFAPEATDSSWEWWSFFVDQSDTRLSIESESIQFRFGGFRFGFFWDMEQFFAYETNCMIIMTLCSPQSEVIFGMPSFHHLSIRPFTSPPHHLLGSEPQQVRPGDLIQIATCATVYSGDFKWLPSGS